MNIDWRLKTWDELSRDELYAILQLRIDVFVIEQNCPYQDVDNKDQKSLHIFGMDANNKCVACLRLVNPGISYDEWSIGRVATSPEVRRNGVGKLIMQKAMDYFMQSLNQPPIRISAQSYLEKFYSLFGFVVVSEPYLEDDIPHIEMLYSTQNKKSD